MTTYFVLAQLLFAMELHVTLITYVCQCHSLFSKLIAILSEDGDEDIDGA